MSLAPARPAKGIHAREAGGQEWRFLVCQACGHMHQFRIEKAARKKEWWNG